jgi:hypothetical protein
MNNLFRKGTLVQVQVGIWQMKTTLDPIDLGITDVPEFVNLGTKQLFPPEKVREFTSIAQQSRYACAKAGFDFFLTGSFFIPDMSLENLKSVLRKKQENFYSLVNQFCDSFETEKEQFLQKHTSHRDLLEPHYPTVEEVRNKFYFRAWFFNSIISSGLSLEEKELEDTYVSWATEAVNSLRKSVRETVMAIETAFNGGEVDGRVLRRLTSLIEALQMKDLLKDDALLNAAKKVEEFVDKKSLQELKNQAQNVPDIYVRNILFT